MNRKRINSRYVTIRDVAELAGTSIATVSYVLNDSKDRYISEELRDRVLNAAAKLNYVKSGLASSLKGKQRGILAVLTPQYENPFFMSMFIAIEKIANQHGYVLSTCNTFDDPQHEKEVLERMLTIRVDGYLVIPTVEGAKNMSILMANNLPFVAIERPLIDVDQYHYVSSDNFEVGYRITEHLIKMGHRRIGMICWDTAITNVHERVSGYKEALKKAGIPFDPSLVKKGELKEGTGKSLTKELMDESDVTALIYAQYLLAEDGISYLRKQKVSIPDDISVVMVGNPAWARLEEVTRIAQAGTKMGEVAARILLDQLEGKNKTGEAIRQIVKSDLFEGKTVKKLISF